jgi:hypothetical protein
LLASLLHFCSAQPLQNPSGVDSEAFASTTPRYEQLPGLIRKYYLFDPETHTGGGAYLWEDRAQAEAFYNAEWRDRLAAKYSVPPKIMFFESPVIIDNDLNKVTVEAAE